MARHVLYSRHEHGPAWAQPANPIVGARLTIPEQAVPVVRTLLSIMKQKGIGYDTVAEASGLLRATLKAWRRRSAPTYATIEAAYNAVGWHFLPCPKIETLPDDIAADLARLAAKMQADIPVVFSAMLDLAADQTFLRERAKERIEARDAERDAQRRKRNRSRSRSRSKPKAHANDNIKQSANAA